MRKNLSAIVLSVMMAGAGLGFAGTASAEAAMIVGNITKITMAPDGKSAVAILKDVKSGEAVTINIADELTLDKLKDKRIVEGDEIRTRFEKSNGKSKSFKKTAGC